MLKQTFNYFRDVIKVICCLIVSSSYDDLPLPDLEYLRINWPVKQQVWMYYRPGTVKCSCIMCHEQSPESGTFLHEMMSWLPSWKYDWCHIRNLTPSVDAYLLEEQSCQISPQSDLKRGSLSFFENGPPNHRNNNEMSSDMRSVADQKIESSKDVKFDRPYTLNIWISCNH